MNGTKREDLELAWHAYRYVAGEMTVDEKRLFEDRLDCQQSAREAVARMVELASAVKALPAEAFHSRAKLSRVLAPAGWVSLGVAACLAVMFGLQTIGPFSPDHSGETNGSPQDTQIALAWTPAEHESVEDDDVLALATSDVEESGDVETPSWLTAVLTHDRDEPTPLQESEVN